MFHVVIRNDAGRSVQEDEVEECAGVLAVVVMRTVLE